MDDYVQLFGFIETPEKGLNLPSKEVFLTSYNDISSVVRKVPKSDFDEMALAKHLKDPVWLKAQLFLHENILEEVLQKTTVIPLKWGSFFKTTVAVREVMIGKHSEIQSLLAKLKGHEEWTVKAYLDRKTLEEKTALDPQIVQLKSSATKATASGDGYLLRERLKLRTKEAADHTVDAVVQSLHEELRKHTAASASCERLPEIQESDGQDLVFKMVYLVAKDSQELFSHAVNEAALQWKRRGFNIHLVGPFPPYYFSDLKLEGCQTHA